METIGPIGGTSGRDRSATRKRITAWHHATGFQTGAGAYVAGTLVAI